MLGSLKQKMASLNIFRVLSFILVLSICVSVFAVLTSQAQVGKLIPITISFEYPKMSVDSKSVDYLKINTGSVVYWFSTSGAADLIYAQDGTLIGSRKWRLSADTLSIDISGKVTYSKVSDYNYIVTRFIANAAGNFTITYKITGEQTTTEIAITSAKAISNLNLTWINQIQKSVIDNEDLTDSGISYTLASGKFISFDWSDVQKTLGDIATTSTSILSKSKETSISFALGSLQAKASITIDPTETYTSAGTFYWIAPAGTGGANISCLGAGGGGGGSNTDFGGGGGAGGGAFSKKNGVSVTSGGNYTVVVGASGAGSASGNGGTGGDSYFIDVSTVLAKGGIGGKLCGGGTASGGDAASGVGDTKWSGGIGAAGTAGAVTGGAGESAGAASAGHNGSSGVPGLGGTGLSDGGDGGGGSPGVGSNGVSGQAPGGGGGGGYYCTFPYAWDGGGGNGAAGKVVIDYFLAPTCVTDGTVSITTATATLKGNISADSGATATQYKFEWDIDSGVPYALNYTSGVGSYPVGNYSININSLTPGTEYFWQFTATNTAGQGNSTEAKFVTLPEDPAALHDTAQINEGITDAWTKGAHTNKSMLRYNLGASAPTAIGGGTQAYFDTGSSFETTGLTSATQYSFSVWSEVTIDGMQQYSAGYVSDSAYTRPDQPTSSAASNPQINSIGLSWTKAARAEQTKVRSSTVGYPATYADGNPVYFGNLSSTTASGLSPNTQYYFSLFAYDNDSGFYSTDYDTATETTLVDAPVVTTGMGEQPVSDTIAQLNGEVTYIGGETPTCTFYWGTTDGGTDPGSWDESHSMGAQSSTFNYNVGSLTPGNTYFYTVYATNSGGNDWASASVQFTMGCLVPGNLTATLVTDYRIDVTWTKTMPVTIVRAGLDNPPDDIFGGISVYRGNGTSVSIYGAFSSMDGNLTFRTWADCTTCLACSSFRQSDAYAEVSLVLVDSGGGNGTSGNSSLTFITNNGSAESVGGVVYLGGFDGVQVSGSGQVLTVSIGGESVEAINSTLWVWLALALALGLSFLSLKAGAYMWFVSCWPWVALATLVTITWLQGVAVLMAVVCLGLFVMGIGSKSRRG